MHTRTRVFAVAALVALSSSLSAQIGRLPRVGRRTPPPQAAPLPPEVPVVARALAYKRSLWSGEAYGMVSMVQVPASVGGLSSYTTFGGGTRADYRFARHFSATMDMTASALGDPAISGTVEAGMRYRPMGLEQRVRPFVDVRGAFLYLRDTYASPTNYGSVSSTAGFLEQSRLSRGLGGVAGTGLEYSLTSSLGLTTGLSVVRAHMTAYRMETPTALPEGSRFWMTTYRFTLGMRYNPTRRLMLAQKPGM